jgi:hypothetical protein
MKMILVLLAATALAATGCQTASDNSAQSPSNTPNTNNPHWPPPSPNTINNPPPGDVANPANPH